MRLSHENNALATASVWHDPDAHAAVDTTFVQFYPTLLPVAEQKHILSAGFLRDRQAAGK